jgi:hypothetical protein
VNNLLILPPQYLALLTASRAITYRADDPISCRRSSMKTIRHTILILALTATTLAVAALLSGTMTAAIAGGGNWSG